MAEFDSYQLREGRIETWSDNLDLSDAPADKVAHWRKLRGLGHTL